MSNGAGSWFAVSRMIFDHYLVGIHNRPYTDTEAWLWLVSRAEFEQSEVVNRGRTIVLDPGQLMAAHSFLAKTWMWSEDKVRWFLKRLQNEAMITRTCNAMRGTNQIQVLTICNYANYQHLNDDQHQAKSHQATHHAEHQAARQADKYIKPYDRRENLTNETVSHQPPPTPPHQPSHQESNTIDTKILVSANKQKRSASATQKKGTRLPADWKFPQEWKNWALDNFAIATRKVETEAANFTDYWKARAGAGAFKLDWEATWRVWMRKNYAGHARGSEAPTLFNRQANGAPYHDPTLDGWEQILAETR